MNSQRETRRMASERSTILIPKPDPSPNPASPRAPQPRFATPRIRTRSRSARALALAAILAILPAGCGDPGAAPGTPAAEADGTPRFPDVTLRVAILDSPDALVALETAAGEWISTRGARLEFPRESTADTPAPASSGAGGPLPDADVYLFPARRLGDLVDVGRLAVIPDEILTGAPTRSRPDPVKGLPSPEEAEAARRDAAGRDPYEEDKIAEVFRRRVARYGTDRYGLPYGGSALVVAYRRDWLAAPALVAAARDAGVSLEPPSDWNAFDALAQFLNGRDHDGDGQPEAAVVLAWGPDPDERLAAEILLARAAAPGRHRDHFSFLFDYRTMEPRVAQPPFVEALDALVAWSRLAPPGADPATLDPDAAREAFRTGRAAILVDRAEMASAWIDPQNPVSVGVFPLPGSARVYDPAAAEWETGEDAGLEPGELNRPGYLPRGGGRLLGVSDRLQGPAREAAMDLVRFLTAPEASRRVARDRKSPHIPVRVNQLAAPPTPGLDLREWSVAVANTLNAPVVLPGPRLPRADEYLADLERAVAAALAGAPSESVLRDVADAWSARVERLGRERQAWHYARELNDVPTAPSPPPSPASAP